MKQNPRKRETQTGYKFAEHKKLPERRRDTSGMITNVGNERNSSLRSVANRGKGLSDEKQSRSCSYARGLMVRT
jgi:hypothetical protein